MKFLPCLAAVAVAALSVSAQSPLTSNVRVEVQMVSMPLEKGLPLLPNLRDPDSIEGAFSQIQKMIATGVATLIAWPAVATTPGQRAVTEDIEEVRYPSEFSEHKPAAATAGEEEKSKTAQPRREG